MKQGRLGYTLSLYDLWQSPLGNPGHLSWLHTAGLTSEGFVSILSQLLTSALKISYRKWAGVRREDKGEEGEIIIEVMRCSAEK